MSGIAAFAFPDGTLELAQTAFYPNSAIWQTSTGWTGGPTQFTNDGHDYPIAACNVAGGDPCVFMAGVGAASGDVAYPSTVQYLTFAQPGTDSSGASQWQEITLPLGNVFDLSAAQLPDGTVQVFALMSTDTVAPTAPALMSCSQSTPGLPSETTHAFNAMSPFEPPLPGAPWGGIGPRAVTLPDGRPQLWCLTSSGTQNGTQQPQPEIVTCHKTTTHAGSPWSAWSTVTSSGPNLQMIAGALGPVVNEILFFGHFDPFTGTWVSSHIQRIYLFGITDGGAELVMASFTPNTTAPSPSGIVWTTVSLPSGIPSGTLITDLAVIPLANGGIQVFILVDSNASNPGDQVIVYTQSLRLAHLAPRLSGLTYWTWSAWEDLVVYVVP
jgi:hypothetical protein